MRRREFIVLAGGAALARPLAVRAQQPSKMPRIGWLGFLPLESPESLALRDAFWQGMRELGYIEGRNIVIEYRVGRIEQFPNLAADLVALKVNLIVAGNTAAARAAHQATTTIPIVCFNLGDPVGERLVASISRPGGNVTGLTILAPELVPKELALLKEAVPKASRVAGLWQRGVLTERTAAEMLQSAEAAARTLGVELQLVSVGGDEDLESAFSTMITGRAEALLVLPSPLSLVERRRIIDFAALHRLPSMSWIREFVQVGGLLSFGVNFRDQYQHGASYVDRLLKGAKPADMPIERPIKLELVINLRTAKTLGLAIPPSLLVLAEELIE